MDTLTIDYKDKNFHEQFVKSLHETGFAIINKHNSNAVLCVYQFSSVCFITISDSNHSIWYVTVILDYVR